MCGLFGVINRDITTVVMKDLIKQGLIVNSLRGVDGAGFSVVDEQGEIHSYKRPLPGWDLVQLIPTLSILDNCTKISMALVHNRASTNGGNKIETSHPINYKHITLVHNGAISNLVELGATWSTHDSTAIALALADKTEKETLELLSGSYALIWHNSLDSTFNIARNELRPLYMATIKKSKSALFGSEDGMLLWLADRNKIEIKEISQVAAGVHIKIPLNPDIKQTISKFHIRANNYQHSGYTGNNYATYMPMKEDAEFNGKYVGLLDWQQGKKFFKFQYKDDPMYGWVVDFTEDLAKDLVIGDTYKLKALEPRVTGQDSSNKAAEVVSSAPIIDPQGLLGHSSVMSQYKCGSDVTFTIESIIERRKGGSISFQGYTEDENLVEVRGFNILNTTLRKDFMYTAIIKTIVHVATTDTTYILIDPPSIKEYVNSAHIVEQSQCGWCDADITSREVINNPAYGISNSGSLCDTCAKQYRNGYNS